MPDTYTPEGCVRCTTVSSRYGAMIRTTSNRQAQQHCWACRIHLECHRTTRVYAAWHTQTMDFDIVEEAESVAAASPNSLPGEHRLVAGTVQGSGHSQSVSSSVRNLNFDLSFFCTMSVSVQNASVESENFVRRGCYSHRLTLWTMILGIAGSTHAEFQCQ